MPGVRDAKPSLLCVCCLLISVSFPVSASAVEPQISEIAPSGFQRGAEVDVQFRGARLDDAAELMLYEPGVTVKALKAEAPNLVKAKLAIAADCRLGLHAVRLRSQSGVSNLRLFAVGALKEIDEVEPNSDFASPQPVELDSTINGVVKTEDVDYFVVAAKKGEPITAEIEGLRLGYTFFDPYIAILNESRFELARSDDAPLLRQDGLCSIVAPEDGKYIVQIRESAYGGNDQSRYRLHLGRFPRPRAVFPAGGAPGQSLDATWIGEATGPRGETIVLPTTAPVGLLYAKTERGVSPSANHVRLIDIPNVIEAEPNNSRSEATVGPAPAAFNGVIGVGGDIDHFRFPAKKNQRFDIHVYARAPLRSPLDPVLNVYRVTGGARIGGNDDTVGPDSYFRFTAPEEDEYVIQVRDHLKAGGPEYVYRVEVTPIKPELTLTLPERIRYISTTAVVPRGNRIAILANARRANFGGELTLAARGMPAGVTAEIPTMAANRSDVPMLFTAAADATPAGALVDLVGKPIDDKVRVEGHLKQRTMLIRGQNNRDVWGHEADRMAMVVANEAPFHVDLVEPKAPIVRNGSMQLKVVARRREGFTAPISVRMLYNPPGIGSSAAVRIQANQNEALIPLTANGAAEIRDWKVCVTGRASHAGGAVESSTQLATLRVADAYLVLTIPKVAVELGKSTRMVVAVEKKQDFAGKAKLQLLGLPSGATAEPIEIDAAATQATFEVKVEEKTRPGRYPNLVCRSVIMESGEPITQTTRGGELRVDKPLPSKPAAPAAPKPTVKPAPPKPPAEKPLSRLEQLRQQKKESE
jgi:hypothetical protein